MENLNDILKDLYKLDPELKQHEKELSKIIEKIITDKPEIKLDEKFAKNLKKILMAEIKNQKEAEEKSSSKASFNFSFLKKLSFSTVGLTTMAMVLVLAFGLIKNQGEKNILLFNQGEIKNLEKEAFGNLGLVLQNNDNRSEEKIAREDYSAQTLGLGGSGNEDARIMPYPEMIKYNYTYVGADIKLDEETMKVYKKKLDESKSQEMAKIISSIKLDVLDLSKLSNPEISNLQIKENKDFGYSLYIDLINNQISINANWEKWPNPLNSCRDENCFKQYQLSMNDMPDEKTLISLADDFLKNQGLQIKSYLPGEVQNQWRRYYNENNDYNYVPENISIIYPLTINNLTVYDQGGNKNGLTVDVNIRHKKVSGLYNITTQNYESSEYEIETEVDKILTFAKEGGGFSPYYSPETKTVNLEIGTPELALMKYHIYNPESYFSEELFVPALVFPVLDKPEDIHYYQNNIVVPLIKDVLNNFQKDFLQPEPRMIDDKNDEEVSIMPIIDFN